MFKRKKERGKTLQDVMEHTQVVVIKHCQFSTV